MSAHQLWAGVAIVFATLASFVTLLAMHIDPTPLFLVLGSVVTPVMAATVVVAKVNTVSQKVDQVDTKVNGHLTDLVSKIPGP